MEAEMVSIFKAMAHPVRLQILRLLGEEGEACVCHLTCALQKQQPYISQQLSVLREAGMVVDSRSGQLVFYRLASPELKELLDLAQDFLRRQGIPPSPEEEIPPAPIVGCPCPKCTLPAAS